MDQMVANRPVLQVRGLTKRFGGLTAVKNLGFEVNAGEIFGLIGPNGSGKSTAMKSVMAPVTAMTSNTSGTNTG